MRKNGFACACIIVLLLQFALCGCIESPEIADEEVYATFWFLEDSAKIGQEINFTAFAKGFDNSTLQFAWDFGDGATGEGAPVCHAFPRMEIFTIAMYASDGEGHSANYSRNIVVYEYHEFYDNLTSGVEKTYNLSVPEGACMVVFQTIAKGYENVCGIDISLEGDDINAKPQKFKNLSDGTTARKLPFSNHSGLICGNWTARLISDKGIPIMIKIAVYPMVYALPPCCANES